MIRSKRVDDKDIPLTDEENAVEDAKELAAVAKQQELAVVAVRDAGAEALRGLIVPYGAEERETWSVQESEARAYLIAPATAQTPMLSAMSHARGISIDILAGKVMENVILFQAAAGAILGAQQKQIDDIERP